MLCVPLGFSQTPNLRITEEVAKFEAAAFKRSLKGTTINRSYRGFFDVTKQSIDIKVNPGIRFIEGAVTTTFTIIEGGYNEIELNCSDSLKVSSVLLDGNSAEYSAGRDFLVIKSSNELVPETNHVLQITYSGIPPATRAFETDTNNYGDTVMWTLSEPYGAKDWWPCKQDLADKFDQLDMRVTVPKKYKVAANGLLQSITPIGLNDLQYHWKHNYPIVTYLVAFAVADYVVMTETLDLKEGELEFVNYVYPQDSATAAEDLREFKNTMDLFEDLLGPYPFRKEHYGHAQFGWGGGMEHQTMSFMANFNHGLVAHELAHQWFGDMVTCGSWADLWLNESFATYCDGLTYDFLFDENVWENWKTISLDAITRNPSGSVNIPDTSDVGRMFSSRLTYRKGSYILHMLRYKMGDEAFFKAIRDYIEDTRHKYGFATTENLIWHLKANGGYKIDEFFNDWFYSQGFPIYQLEWYQTEQNKLHLVLSQEQSYIWEGTFFDMEVPVRVIDDVEDSTLVFDHYKNNQEMIIDWPSDRPVRLVYLDQDSWVLKGPDSKVIKSDYKAESVEYKIVPNPVQHELNLQFSNRMLPNIEVQIFDIMGKLMYHHDYTTGLADRELKIDTEFLNNGAYTLQLRDYWGAKSLKFIKAGKN